MEWTIRRSIDGALLLHCDEEFRLLSHWLELQLQQSASFAIELSKALQVLDGGEQYRLDAAGFRFIASLDEVQLYGNQSDELDACYSEQDLQLEAQYNSCGYDDFLLLLDSIIHF